MFTFIDLFSGIGGIRIAFENVGSKCVFSCEKDKYAQKTYLSNFRDQPHGDITQIPENIIPPFDILTAGFPCQPFSNAGLRKGFEDTRGTLFFDIVRIARYHAPQVIFLENVKGLLSHDSGKTFKVIIESLEDMGYRVFYEVLHAKDFGLPQNRPRLYIVAFSDHYIEFEFPKPLNIPTRVGNLLDKEVSAKYTISDECWIGAQRHKENSRIIGNSFGYRLLNEDSEFTPTLTAHYSKGGAEIVIEQKGRNPRKLTVNEARKLQGFPEGFIIPVSDSQAYKQFGNSVAIPVVQAIAQEIISCI